MPVADESSSVQDIGSARPYRRAARIYFRKGWLGPLPLPPRAKEKPPGDFTGRGKPYPDEEQIDTWIAERPAGNICMRHSSVEIDTDVPDGTGLMAFDVIGIDVDDYTSGGKQKLGGAQFAALVKRLGPLPATWRSTSRGVDNISGIRFFLAPAGLRWRGKADKDIDIISPGYRYSIVYPSWHPEDRQYRWVDETGPTPVVCVSVKDVPAPSDFPQLPPEWVDYLTSGGMLDEDVEIDMDSSVDSIVKWARKTLPKPNPDFGKGGMCKGMRKRVTEVKAAIDEEPSSHDKIRDAHWSIVRLASEGHSGWQAAVRITEEYWKKDVKARDKRTLSQLRGEVFRSKLNALRKLKGDIDKHAEDGLDFISPACACFSETGPGTDGNGGPSRDIDGVAINRKAAHDPDEYARSDDGNAEHLLDLIGLENVHYIPEYKRYVFWSDAESRWLTDTDGLARRLFRTVRDRQYAHADNLHRTGKTLLTNGQDDDGKRAMKEAGEWRKWADRSGSIAGAVTALEAAQSFSTVTMQSEKFDSNELLLGYDGGVIELNPRDPDCPWRRRPAARENYITLSTRVPLIDNTKRDDMPADYVAAQDAFAAYLDYFLPEPDLRGFVQKVLGYGLLGDNRERLIVFLTGPTTSGKGTMIGALTNALGDYCGTASMQVFQEHKLNPALAEALPKRVLTLSELSASAVFHADALKRIAGGVGERMTAELKGSNTTITRMPAFLPVIATNETPHVRDADEALMRRIIVLPFRHKLPKEQEDTSIAATLAKHGGPVVLNWLLEGFAAYVTEGIDPASWPSEVIYETKKFGERMSDIGEFVSDRIRRSKNAKTPCVDIYNEYLEFCSENNEQQNRILAAKPFGRRMSALGYVSKQGRIGPQGARGSVVRYYEGIDITRNARKLAAVKSSQGTVQRRKEGK